jgi:hypothetical protein
MKERDWFFAVGPLNEAEAQRVEGQIQSQLGTSLDARLINHRLWFAEAWDPPTVEAVLPVLEAGLEAETWSVNTRNIVLGVVSGMRTWLEREHDERRSNGGGRAAGGRPSGAGG